MKRWTINIEEAQKFLNEEDPENRYLIEPRGYQKMTWGEEFWIFVNDVKDKWIDEDGEISVRKISHTSHLFRIDNYLICVYTSAKDEELHFQLSGIYFAILNSSERVDPFIEKEFIELYDKIFNSEFTKKSQELADKLRDIAIDLYNYRSQQAVYSNAGLRSEIENVYKDIGDLMFSIQKSCKDIQ